MPPGWWQYAPHCATFTRLEKNRFLPKHDTNDAHGTSSVAFNAAFLVIMAVTDCVWTQVVINRTHTGGLSAFAAAAAQVCREPSSPPALCSQPSHTRVAQFHKSQSALKAESAPIPPLYQGPGRAATVPCIPPAAASISPWAAIGAPTDASALAFAAPLTIARVARQAELVALPQTSKEEHRAQLVQLLEDACRQAPAHQTCSTAIARSHHSVTGQRYVDDGLFMRGDAQKGEGPLTWPVTHAGFRASTGRC